MKREALQDSLELKRKNGALWRGAGILTLAFLLFAGLTACGDDEEDAAPQEDTMEQSAPDTAPQQEPMESPEDTDSGEIQSEEMNDNAAAKMQTQGEAMPQADQPSDDQPEQSPTEQGDMSVDETREPTPQPSEETQSNQ